MSNTRPVVSKHHSHHGEARGYVTGFILSFVLTVIAYLLAVRPSLPRISLLIILGLLAIIQFIVQLVYFFHIASETRPRWRLKVFGFMALIVIILVAGSIWIMSNLNYHLMSPATSPAQENQYLRNHEGL